MYLCNVNNKNDKRNMKRLDKNLSIKVSVYKNWDYLGKVNADLCTSIKDVKLAVYNDFTNNGIVKVVVCQDGGYYKEFNMNTNEK